MHLLRLAVEARDLDALPALSAANALAEEMARQLEIVKPKLSGAG